MTKKTKTELLKESRNNIKDSKTAKSWLKERELIVEGESLNTTNLAMALLWAAASDLTVPLLI